MQLWNKIRKEKMKKKKHVDNTDISITYFVKPPKAVSGIGHRKEV